MSEETQTVSNTALQRTAAQRQFRNPNGAEGPARRCQIAGTFSFTTDRSLQTEPLRPSVSHSSSEIDAQKACARSGKPYLKIETLRVEFAVIDGKLVAVATPAKK